MLNLYTSHMKMKYNTLQASMLYNHYLLAKYKYSYLMHEAFFYNMLQSKDCRDKTTLCKINVFSPCQDHGSFLQVCTKNEICDKIWLNFPLLNSCLGISSVVSQISGSRGYIQGETHLSLINFVILTLGLGSMIQIVFYSIMNNIVCYRSQLSFVINIGILTSHHYSWQ